MPLLGRVARAVTQIKTVSNPSRPTGAAILARQYPNVRRIEDWTPIFEADGIVVSVGDQLRTRPHLLLPQLRRRNLRTGPKLSVCSPGLTHRDHPTPPVSDIKAVQGLVESEPVGWEPGVAGEVVAARLLDLFEAAANVETDEPPPPGTDDYY
jgi:hypothetical protein